MKSCDYQEILTQFFKGKVNKYYPNNTYFFQHDNAPPHVSKSSINFLKKHRIDYLNWPANSPDMNPIENCWKLLSSEVYKNGKIFSNKASLWNSIQRAWDSLDDNIVKNLCLSFEKRLNMCLEKEGKWIP